MSREALLAAKYAVIQDQARKRVEDAKAKPLPKSRRGIQVTLVVIALALAAVLVIRPAWLFPTIEVESAMIKEASLRVRISIEAERVERYRRSAGRLPSTLLESGGDTTSLQYLQDGKSYSITGENDGHVLTYRSTMPPAEFLGSSYALIRARSGR
ncbi:MAG: hypothetical protein OEW17_11330 [Gemmatimonadota bacterium]|nr:hypothetical protein [Gemmatimonadota bacterium]MDH4349390.1 hypothetical protein [Gemmatimonadota bacterium]MDH5283876.1 hypothetical protein [Gemmatimonadota bacterium]